MLAVVALHHCAAASLRKMRSVDREIALKVEELWTAACILRKWCADAADLNILRSRRRTTWCEFPVLFWRSPCSW